MKTFEYDPERTFRGWLRRLCESRVVDFLRQRQAAALLGLDERVADSAVAPSPSAMGPEGTDDGVHLFLVEEGAKVQAAVRARVKPHTWDAFWLVAICDWTVERTAKDLGMSQAPVYAARERVARMLRDEGKGVSDHEFVGS